MLSGDLTWQAKANYLNCVFDIFYLLLHFLLQYVPVFLKAALSHDLEMVIFQDTDSERLHVRGPSLDVDRVFG